jgi:hypothetical protein
MATNYTLALACTIAMRATWKPTRLRLRLMKNVIMNVGHDFLQRSQGRWNQVQRLDVACCSPPNRETRSTKGNGQCGEPTRTDLFSVFMSERYGEPRTLSCRGSDQKMILEEMTEEPLRSKAFPQYTVAAGFPASNGRAFQVLPEYFRSRER